jgi:nicotinamide riboside transporter PnuC
MKFVDIFVHKTTKKIMLIITGVLIIATSIITKQHFIRILPLFVSLFVMLYQTEARRSAYLIGGLNAALYAFIYFFYFKLYGNAISSVLISCPLQIATFINWKKHAYKKSTYFKKMSTKMRVWLSVGSAAIFAVIFAILTAVGSPYAILDNASTILGTITTVIILFAYIEYAYLMPLHTLLALMLQIQLFLNDPSSLPYLIMAVYNFYCGINILITVRRLYKQQQAELAEQAN